MVAEFPSIATLNTNTLRFALANAAIDRRESRTDSESNRINRYIDAAQAELRRRGVSDSLFAT